MKNHYPTVKDRPIADFDMTYTWHTEHWQAIFDKQINLITKDIARARVEKKLIIYLSCPISGRGGGHSDTNVKIANHTTRRLLAQWGERFFILNPAQYQLESKEGAGLLQQHMRTLKLTDSDIALLPKPTGGDYMRMWTKVLVEDHHSNTGEQFDGFYFLGPKDVSAFFRQSGAQTTTAAIEDYIARQFSCDKTFRHQFRDSDRLQHFFKFYAIKASSAFSLGCHDEWNIFVKLNQKRLQISKQNAIGDLLAGYFDGEQLPPNHSLIDQGYAQS